MIKFFRHIRQAMIKENRVSKYLLYAIGEIILVVIGILIALQINNWNSDRQLRVQEQEYLTSLKNEFSINLKLLNQSIQEIEDQKQNIEALLLVFDKNVCDTMSDSTKASLIYAVLSGFARFSPSTGVLTDVTSTGNLNVILNKELRQNLATFGNTLDDVKLVENGTKELMVSLREFIHKNSSIRKLMISRGIILSERSISDSVGYDHLFQSVEFENLLLDHYLVSNSTNGSRFFLKVKDEIEQILTAIEQELSK
jgi:hypothetical protein